MSKQSKLKIEKVQISKLDSYSKIKGGGFTDINQCSQIGGGGNISVDGNCPTKTATGTEIGNG